MKAVALALLSLLMATSARSEILIGVPIPMTGEMAWSGELGQLGAAQAVDEVNRQGGLLGQSVELVLLDDACNDAQGEAAARLLVDRDVAVVIGHSCSAPAVTASSVYDQAGMLFLATSATNPLLTERGHRLTFRTIGRDDGQADAAVQLIESRFPEASVAVVHDGHLYGRDLAGLVRHGLRRLGREPVVFAAIEPGNLDHSALVAELMAAGAGVIFFGGYSQPGGLLRRQTWEAGLTVPMIGGDGLAADDFWFIAGADAARATLMTSPPDVRYRPEAAAVVQRFRDAGQEPQGTAIDTYAAVEVWAQAVVRAGTTEPAAVAAALRAGRFKIVLGEVGFDAKGDLTGAATWDWFGWRDGTYVRLQDIAAMR